MEIQRLDRQKHGQKIKTLLTPSALLPVTGTTLGRDDFGSYSSTGGGPDGGAHVIRR